MMTRRECLTTLAASAAAATARAQVPGAPPKAMRGAFMILHTPFTEAGAVDWDDLTREVEFVDRSGCAGVVWPQGSSSVASLTTQERLHGMDLLARVTKGKRVTLVLGVQGRDIADMQMYTGRAEAAGCDAVIAMPPTTGRTMDEYREYFRALARATSRPVIVQTSGGARDLVPSTDLIIDLAREFPHLGYVKEESDPVVERMKTLVAARPPMRAVFGAQFGVGWLYEMRLGLDGVITGSAMYADVMAALWNLHLQGRHEDLREAFSRLLLMRNLRDQVPGVDLYIMKKRGIFKTMATRGRNRPLTRDEIDEIEFRFAALRPYLMT